MKYSLVCDKKDLNLTIEQEKYNFLKEILKDVGIDTTFLPEFYSEYEKNEIYYKIKLRSEKNKKNIPLEIDDEKDLIIWCGEKIGEWKDPEIVYMEYLDPEKNTSSLCVEVFFDTWSAYDKFKG